MSDSGDGGSADFSEETPKSKASQDHSDRGIQMPEAGAEVKHGAYSMSVCPCRDGSVKVDENADSITIGRWALYDLTKMVLHLNIQISIAAVAGIMAYLTLTLCGLYRFIEILDEFFRGCKCRICKGEFKIVRRIDGGAYGQIHLAHFVGPRGDYNFEVVLKSIPIGDVSCISGTQQECRKLLSLNHKYVMKYYDDFLHREWGWNPVARARLYCVLVTEYCERGSLADLIEDEYSTFTEEYIVGLFRKIAMALHYVHEQSMIHRDIKSPNIMLKSDDVVRLGDFGVSDTFAAKKSKRKMRNLNLLEMAAMAERNKKRGRFTIRVEEFDEDFMFSDNLEAVDSGTDDADDGNLSSAEDFFAIPDIHVARPANVRVNRRVKAHKRLPHGPREASCCIVDGEAFGANHEASPVQSPLNGKAVKRRSRVHYKRRKSTQMFCEETNLDSEHIGTYCYMAPEILQNCAYGRASDIWALGCVLLELCSGVFMWELDYNLGERPESATILVLQLPPMISRAMRSLITKMLSADPERRPSAAQILNSRVMKKKPRRQRRANGS
ncbi:protein kinase [Babesia caballi]|uniref:non-specific serine/threonine protein kinase n=1 Tax=Babesia caballi TaxID=5871 RepID=A0AAV4M387_BABCB|nr:protein kinase [Babesia caballi]